MEMEVSNRFIVFDFGKAFNLFAVRKQMNVPAEVANY
jgi:hypothetical protein